MAHFTDQLIADYANTLTESYNSPYLGQCDSSFAKKFYGALKSRRLDLDAFHKAFDDEIENIGLMSVFADDGTLAHRGTYGPMKNYSDQSNSAIIGLKKLWGAQFGDNLKPSTKPPVSSTSTNSSTNNTQNSTAYDKLKAEAEAGEADVLALIDQGLYQKLKDIAIKLGDTTFGTLKIQVGMKPVVSAVLSDGKTKKIWTILHNITTKPWPNSPTLFTEFNAADLAADINKNLPTYIDIAEEVVNYLEFLDRPEWKNIKSSNIIATFTYNINGKRQSITADSSGYKSWDTWEFPVLTDLKQLPLPTSAKLISSVVETNFIIYVSAKLSEFTDAEITKNGWEEGAINPIKSAHKYANNTTFTEVLRQQAKDTGSIYGRDTYFYTADGFDFWGKFKAN